MVQTLLNNIDNFIKAFFAITVAGIIGYLWNWYASLKRRSFEIETKRVEYDIKAIRDRNARRLVDDIIADANASREKRLSEDSENK